MNSAAARNPGLVLVLVLGVLLLLVLLLVQLQAMHNYNIRSFSGCAQVVRLAEVDVVMQRRTLEDGCVGSFH
jgi:hypothetical protein